MPRILLLAALTLLPAAAPPRAVPVYRQFGRWLDGADCGRTARLELSEAALQALVGTLDGREPAADLPPPRAGLNIQAVRPERPR